MAMYLKAAGGNWSAAATWSATGSGGGDNAGPPIASTDVILEAGSGAVTIDSGAVCRSLNCTSGTGDYNNTITHNAAVTLTIGDGTAGAGNVALKFSATTTYTKNDTDTSAINFISTSTTVQAVDFGSSGASRNTGNVTFNGVGGSWQLTSAATTTSTTATWTLTNGTLDTNGQTCSWGLFSSNNSNTRVLTLGASSITIKRAAGAAVWDTLTTSNMTLNAGTSTITFNGSNANMNAGTLTFYDVSFTGPNVQVLAYSSPTFHNLSRIGTATKTDGFGINNTPTITGTLTLTGNSITNRLLVRTNTQGAKTITAAAVSITNCDFTGITAAGAAIPFTGTSLGDAGGNSNITFDTPVTRYWVATAGGNWSATTSWSTTSGGGSGASVPLVQDTVVFDNLSITSTGKTITVDMPRVGTLDFTNILNSPILSMTVSAGAGQQIVGALTLITGMTTSGTNSLGITPTSNASVITGGVSITWAVGFSPPGNPVTVTLADNFTTTSALTFSWGTLTVNANVTCPTFSLANNQNGTRVLNMGTGTWTLNGTGTVWNNGNPTNCTVNAQTSTIVVSDTSATDKTFTGGGKTYNIISITTGGTGKVTFQNDNTFSQMTQTGGSTKTIQFTAGSITKVTGSGTPFFKGAALNLITLQSTTGGSAWTIIGQYPSWETDFISLQDSAGALLSHLKYAGANSTNVSGNTGWIFGAPESVKNVGYMTTTSKRWGKA